MICVSIFARRHEPGQALSPRWIFPALLLLAVFPDFCPDNELDPEPPDTGAFLDPDDFVGSYDVPPPPLSDTVFSGQSSYNGHLVFANLPRAIVDDVLPSNLHLATSVSASYQDVHPIILLYGDQLNGTFVFTFPSVTIAFGTSYKELVILIPFVQRDGGTKWHNYVVRMYLDNDDAIQIGNLYYGYFKQRAVLTEVAPTVTLSELDVTRSLQTVFEWTAQNPSGGFVPSTSAMATLDNYQDAIEIMSMPLLGTLFGTAYICSYWDWNLQNADVRSIKVTSRFLQSPRAGTASWVSQGPVASDEKFAFEIRGLVWQMAFPALPCSF